METGYINNWHKIWSKRKFTDATEGTIMEKLISVDGFDSPLGLMAEADWRNYVKMFADRTGIVSGDSLFEVGCGGGAFLYPFYESGHEVSGIDYSEELVKVATMAMPLRKNYLEVAEAVECKSSYPASIVIANHVIHYFPSLAYAANVISIMLEKAIKTVSISGIPNADLRQASESARKGLLTEEEYELKYKGLEILYFEKKWFEEIAKEKGVGIKFYEHAMPGFAQNHFRYDCIMMKR
jgi:SAM-dependent methyltransferase